MSHLISDMHYEEWLNYSPVVEARYVAGYTIWLHFEDGTEGEIDLADELWGECFEPLKNVEFFKQFSLNGETLVWPNGEDFAPEFLYWTVLDRVASTRPV